MGAFDIELEEHMARELLDFLHFARRCGVRVQSKKPVPTTYQARDTRLTTLGE